MRQILIYILPLLILLSCNNKNEKGTSDGYKISGKIKTPEKDGYITLEEFDEKGFIKHDSIKVNNDGSYELKGKIAEPGFYKLNIFNKQAVIFVLENKSIEINADGEANPQAFFEVKGSKETDDFVAVNKIYEEFQGQVQKLQSEAMMSEVLDTPKVQKQYEALRDQHAGQIKQSIRKMGPSVTAVFATNYLDKDADFEFLDSLAKVVEKEYPDSKYSKQFINNIKVLRSIAVGRVAPDISLTDPEGKVVSLSSLKGKYVLIDFWASWCGPCRMENPNVVKMYNKFKDKGFEIFGVSLDNDKFKWVQAIEKDRLTWAQVSDLKGWQSEVAAKYNVAAIPATYLIDKEGKIVAKNLRGKELEKKLEEILM